MSAASTLADSRTPSTVMLGSGPLKNNGVEGITNCDVEPKQEKPAGMNTADEEERGEVVQYPDNVVGWDGPDDPECPRNWPSRKKVLFVLTTSSLIASVSFGSSVFGPATKITAAEFDVPIVVMQLTVTLWILGLFAGPIFFGPMSELVGHSIPLAISTIGLAIFQLPIALGNTVQTILICRFFSGVFGSGIFSVVSGMYVELYEPIPRGVALGLSSISINLGATIAPIAGSYLTYTANWRWTAWATLIIVVFFGITAMFLVRESSTPAVLRMKAKRLRLETGNWALHAKSEETSLELGDIAYRYLTKPMRMFVTEPILIIFTAYLTLVYGILYLSFQAFPVAFQQRGWSVPVSSLPFAAVVLGVFSAWGLNSLFTVTWYKTRVLSRNGPPLPEFRLPPMILGGVLLPPSLLWFGWSGNVHPASQVIATYFIGLGLLLVFVPGISYIVDVYQFHANSAIAIHVVVRSLIACSFPLFANIMYNSLGVAWATSLLAFLCIALAPAPLVFYIYGQKIRSWSAFAFDE